MPSASRMPTIGAAPLRSWPRSVRAVTTARATRATSAIFAARAARAARAACSGWHLGHQRRASLLGGARRASPAPALRGAALRGAACSVPYMRRVCRAGRVACAVCTGAELEEEDGTHTRRREARHLQGLGERMQLGHALAEQRRAANALAAALDEAQHRQRDVEAELRRERQARAVLSGRVDELHARNEQLAAVRSENDALEGHLSEAELRVVVADSRYRTLEDECRRSQAARFEALAQCRRAELQLHLREDQERRAGPVKQAAVRWLIDAAVTLTRSAAAAESMRSTHIPTERHALIARAWLALERGEPARSLALGVAGSGAADAGQPVTPAEHGTSTPDDDALTSAAHAFAEAAQALARAWCEPQSQHPHTSRHH